MARHVLKPLGYIEILDRTIDIYRRNFLLLFGIAGSVLIPFTTLYNYYATHFTINVRTGNTHGAISLPNLIVMYLISYIVTAAVMWAASGLYLGNKPTIPGSYMVILKRIIPFILTMLISMLLIAVGSILFFIPGIIMFIITSFAMQALILENRQYIDAIRRSRELIRDEWTKVLVLWILISLIIFAFNLPSRMIYGHMETPIAGSLLLVKGLVSGIVQALLLPIQTIALVLLYYDIRIRKEGFDIEKMAADLGNPTPSQE